MQKLPQVMKNTSCEFDKAASHVNETLLHEDDNIDESLQVTVMNGLC